MEAQATEAAIKAAQAFLQITSALHLTSWYWPQEAKVEDCQTYDFIVVGAGSGGCVLANRLAESFNVVLIEAGGDPPLESVIPSLFVFPLDSSNDWRYRSENDGYIAQGHKDNVIAMYRGKMLGGTSALNAMVYARGSPADYNSWAEYTGNDIWGWDSVLPYMIKSERLESIDLIDSRTASLHGTEGLLGVSIFPRPEEENILNAFGELYEVVLDLNSNHTKGYSRTMFTVAEHQRQSLARAFLTPDKNCKYLHVVKNTLVTKVLFDDNKNAIGVEALRDGKKLTFKARKEVILSAGAFNTPQLLMLSGIGPKEHLQSFGIDVIADLPVGQDLQDHASVVVPIKLPKSKEFKSVSITDFPLPVVMGLVALNESQSYPDYETLCALLSHNIIEIVILGLCTHFFAFKDEICQALYRDTIGNDVMFPLVSFLHPESTGQVLLQSNDPKDPPKVYLGYFSKDKDLENAVKFVEDFTRLLDTTYFKSMDAQLVDPNLPECKDFKFRSKEYWRCYILLMMFSEWHFCGTAAMGRVLNSHLQVKEVNQLRVVDASAMPIITSGNINVPVIMIAEKAADLIKNDHKATVDGCDTSKSSHDPPKKKNGIFTGVIKDIADNIKLPLVEPNIIDIANEYVSKITQFFSKDIS